MEHSRPCFSKEEIEMQTVYAIQKLEILYRLSEWVDVIWNVTTVQ